MTCPECGQQLPDKDGLRWTVKQAEGYYDVSVTDGKHAGWALDLDEAKARWRALTRLHYYQDIETVAP